MRHLLLTTVLLAALGALPARGEVNVPLCVAIKKNWDDCQSRQDWRHRRWEWERYRAYQEGRDWIEPPEYRRDPPDEGCAAWIFQLKANRCF